MTERWLKTICLPKGHTFFTENTSETFMKIKALFSSLELKKQIVQSYVRVYSLLFHGVEIWTMAKNSANIF